MLICPNIKAPIGWNSGHSLEPDHERPSRHSPLIEGGLVPASTRPVFRVLSFVVPILSPDACGSSAGAVG